MPRGQRIIYLQLDQKCTYGEKARQKSGLISGLIPTDRSSMLPENTRDTARRSIFDPDTATSEAASVEVRPPAKADSILPFSQLTRPPDRPRVAGADPNQAS